MPVEPRSLDQNRPKNDPFFPTAMKCFANVRVCVIVFRVVDDLNARNFRFTADFCRAKFSIQILFKTNELSCQKLYENYIKLVPF